ncbi:MAG: hypothetical protein AAF654_00970 [Myxococcota bacterium]
MPLRPTALLTVLLASGCGDSDVDCAQIGFSVCAVTSTECVQATTDAVACELGLAPMAPPAVRTLSTAEYQLENAMEITATEIVEFELAAEGLAQFDLLPEGYTFDQARSELFEAPPLGYYDGGIGIVTDIQDEDSQYFTLVHEIVHAYQDREHDLFELIDRRATSRDRLAGLQGLYEGEATAIEALAGADILQLQGTDPAFDQFWLMAQEETLDDIRDAANPYWRATILPYFYGGEVIFRRILADGPDAIRALYSEPFESARQVATLADGLIPPAKWSQDETLQHVAVPTLPSEYTLVGVEAEGYWMLQRAFQAYDNVLRMPELLSLAADSLSIHRNEMTDDVVAVWRLRFDSPEPNDALAARLATLPPDIAQRTLNDGDVVLMAGGSRELLDRIDRWEPATFAPKLPTSAARSHRRIP